MGKIRRFIPFEWWPRNWGASGKIKDMERAAYYYDGEELDRILLDIKYDDKTSLEYKREVVKIDYKYGYISEAEYKIGLMVNDPTLTPKLRNQAILTIKKTYDLITDEQFNYEFVECEYDDKNSRDYKKRILELDHEYGKINDFDFDLKCLEIDYDDHNSVEYKKEVLKVHHKHGELSDIDFDLQTIALEYDDENDTEKKVRELEVLYKHGKLTQNEFEKQAATLMEQPWFNIVDASFLPDAAESQFSIEFDWNSYFIDFLRAQGWNGVTDEEIANNWFEYMLSRIIDPNEEFKNAEPMTYNPYSRTTRKKNGDKIEYS